MNSTEIQLLEEIATVLQELMNVTKVTSYVEIKRLLFDELDTREKRWVYDLTDGKKSVRDISKATGVNISSISKWSQIWEGIGIIVESRESDVPGRREKLFELDAYQIK